MTWKLWLLGSVACCGVLTAAHWLGVRAGRAEVEAAWSIQRAADAQAIAKLQEQARESERGMQRYIEELRGKHVDELVAIDRQHSAAVERLRTRAGRPADYVPAPAEATGAGPAAGCGADALYREDAAAALGIARDADIVRAALNQCRAQYEAAARTLSLDDPQR